MGQSAMAALKVKVGDQFQIAAGEGNGPVNALTGRLPALKEFYPSRTASIWWTTRFG